MPPNYALAIRIWSWALLGVALLLLGMVALLLLISVLDWPVRVLLSKHHIPEQIIFVIIILLSIILSLPSIYCFHRAKRFAALPAQRVLARDRRPPVLYLRSFREDRLPSWTRLTQFEETLAEVMKEIGPFIALGAPGEKLPQLGAARMYLQEKDWQEEIRDLMSRAQLMVFWAGDSPGFWWEVFQAVKLMAPERLLFFVTSTQKSYERFREQADKYLPCVLPEYQTSWRLKFPVIIVCFDNNWTPNLLEGPLSAASFMSKKERVRDLKQTLALVWWRLEQLKKAQGNPSVIIPNSCPRCGSSFQRAYIEDGGQGDWCPVCKVSLQKMRGEI
jgi:predicted Zn-ribbon and HTH transcriptional regulator